MNKWLALFIAWLIVGITIYDARSDYSDERKFPPMTGDDLITLFLPAMLGMSPREAPCLEGLFTGSEGTLKHHVVPTPHPGRMAIGDLSGNGETDFVISNRDRISAVDICGNLLWAKPATTNWDIASIGSGASENAHPWWNWSRYGVIYDIDYDGVGEFLPSRFS